MKKIRYAVVGAGWISQEAFMPSVDQTGNSVMMAIVSGHPENAGKLAKFYGIEHIYSYERYDEMLSSGIVDAVYIALPNEQHADFTIRAAKAGVHALVEKPLAATVAEAEAMIAAAAAAKTFLMTAYRLRHEPGTLEILDMVRRGEIGEPRMFSSVFSFQIPAGNHRLKPEHWGGPLQDLGVYCLNAARLFFQAEPTEAIAMTTHGNGDARFAQVEDTICATLRFPGDRIANFMASFGAEGTDMYRIVGTKGEITVEPGYRFETARRYRLTRDGKLTEKEFADLDHFSGQTAYFSDCILSGTPPEADGEEGLADMRALVAIEAAAKTGKPQPIASPPRKAFPELAQARAFPRVSRRLLL